MTQLENSIIIHLKPYQLLETGKAKCSGPQRPKKKRHTVRAIGLKEIFWVIMPICYHHRQAHQILTEKHHRTYYTAPSPVWTDPGEMKWLRSANINYHAGSKTKRLNFFNYLPLYIYFRRARRVLCFKQNLLKKLNKDGATQY